MAKKEIENSMLNLTMTKIFPSSKKMKESLITPLI